MSGLGGATDGPLLEAKERAITAGYLPVMGTKDKQ